jgi:nucleoside-diphosphate-sugar epimerase
VDEGFPLAPFPDPYPVTKAEGDKVVQRMILEDQLPAVILRPGILFGPGDQTNFSRLADRLRGGRSIVIGSGRNHLPLVYVTDVVQALILALDSERAVSQAYNIGNDEPLTQQEFLEAIAREIGATQPRLHVPYVALYAATFAAERLTMVTGSRRPPIVTRFGVKLYGSDNRLVIDKARRELGYAPRVNLREGVRLAAAWYRDKGSSTARAEPAVAR